jgi:ABC-type dipeptide/oligopeptide/nickel transport system permease subunit
LRVRVPGPADQVSLTGERVCTRGSREPGGARASHHPAKAARRAWRLAHLRARGYRAAGAGHGPYDPIAIKSADRLQAPSWTHLLGTDDFGRDILSRVIYGARISMLLGLGAVAISTALAAMIGVASGYYGGRVDTILQRCIDTMMAFPGLVVLLTIMAMLGQGLGNVILALGIGATAGNARIIRSAVLAIRENQYVEVARATGCRDWQIIARHILPNVAAPIMVVVTLGLGVAILAESSLSFLGFGVPPPTPSWGAMLGGSGRTYMLQAPWMAVFPGIAISLAVFGFNMLGDALRDLLDPKLRGRG